MVRLNSKGQSFSTFQLLISAVVALAILGLLITIINQIRTPTDSQISTEATNLIKSQVSKPSDLRSTLRLQFGENDSLNVKAIASASGVVSDGQICISKGDHPSPDSFYFTDDAGTIMKSKSNLGVKLAVMCDVGNQLEDDLTHNGYTGDWMQSTQCQQVKASQQTGCIVAVRAA